MPRKGKRRSEYIILTIGQGIKVGSTVNVVGAGSTLEEARKLVGKMGSAAAGKVAILEKKLVILRKPSIELEETDEPLMARSSTPKKTTAPTTKP